MFHLLLRHRSPPVVRTAIGHGIASGAKRLKRDGSIRRWRRAHRRLRYLRYWAVYGRTKKHVRTLSLLSFRRASFRVLVD
jgi:hypothetical protein